MPARAGRPGGRRRHCHCHCDGGDGGRARRVLAGVAVVFTVAAALTPPAAPVFAQTSAAESPAPTPPPAAESPAPSPSPSPAPLPTPSPPAESPSPPSADELARAQDLVRANALGLAQEVLESRAPALRPAAAWLAWERQLWVVYRLRGRWAALLARAQPALEGADWPAGIRREARLQALKALVELRRAAEARRLIAAVLADADAPGAHQRQARRALIAVELAEGQAAAARRALREFQSRYGLGARDASLQLLTAAVLLRAGEVDAAVSELAAVDSAPARLLKLYARLQSRELPPAEVAARASALPDSAPARWVRAVAAQAHAQAGAWYPLADALEAYHLAPPPPSSPPAGVYPQFAAADLLAAYARIAAHQIRRAGAPAGEAQSHLDLARALPPALGVARRALFAHLTATAASENDAETRQAALDGYVGEIIDSGRIRLIPLLFGGGDAPLGELSLGGDAALRLGAAALAEGDFRLAAAAHAAMRAFPAGRPAAARQAWLLRAGRVDLLAGHHARGAAKLREYLESFSALTAAQTDAVLQPIFDLQALDRHALALPLLGRVDALAPAGKHRREIAFWLAESYAGAGDPRLAAAAFLRSAMAGADSFDRWGRAARLRAAEALLDARLFADARRLLQDLLAAAATDARRIQLQQALQRARLLEAAADSPSPGASP